MLDALRVVRVTRVLLCSFTQCVHTVDRSIACANRAPRMQRMSLPLADLVNAELVELFDVKVMGFVAEF